MVMDINHAQPLSLSLLGSWKKWFLRREMKVDDSDLVDQSRAMTPG